MINLSDRAKQELTSIFKKFKNKSFDETDIEKLLLHLRAQFKDQRHIWEFASFIAHPEERDQGVFHQALDVYWAKMKYIRGENKPPLDIGKIDEKLYKTLIIGSIETNIEEDLKNEFNMNREQCLKQVKKSFSKKGKSYYLKIDNNTDRTVNILNHVVSTLNNKPVIQTGRLLDEIQYCLKDIAKILEYNINVKQIIQEQGTDILLCIMALTHSARFKLSEGSSGYCKLRVSINSYRMLEGILSWNLELMAVVNINGSKTQWPIMSLECDIRKYMPDVDELTLSNSTSRLPYHFNAIRNQLGDLVLGEKL